MNLIERVKSFAHGGAILLEWTLDGIVVEQEKAQGRADVCTGRLSGKPCPNNVPDWEFTEQVSAVIKRVVELKNHLQLKTLGEKSLHTCSACACPLKSKVYLPIEQLSTTKEESVKLVEWCWIIKESKEHV